MRRWYPLYVVLMNVAAGVMPLIGLFSPKVRLWWRARRTSPPTPPLGRPVLWMHCASVGEFEQGRPILEYLLQQAHPRPYVVLTFFSPSGWQRYQQSYPVADWIGPAPLDLPWIVQRWVHTLRPTAVFFVKYDLWPALLHALQAEGCPMYLLAAHVVPLKGLRWWWRRQLLKYMRHIFVQTQADQLRLSTAGFAQVSVAGDSRLVRVKQLAENWLPVSGIAEWVDTYFCIIAGSVWEEDVHFLAQACGQLRGQNIRWILVPHEVSPKQLKYISRTWPVPLSFYSEPEWNPRANTLVIDTMGLLAYLYAYAHAVWIGGGFGRGIHNVLEAVVYKKPVFFGPNYTEFPEAVELVQLGVAESFRYPVGFANAIKSLVRDPRRLQLMESRVESYLADRPDTPALVWEHLHKEPWIRQLLTSEG